MTDLPPVSGSDDFVAASPSPADTIRTALQGAMVGVWGRENALRALAELEAERDRYKAALELIAGGEYADAAENVAGDVLSRV